MGPLQLIEGNIVHENQNWGASDNGIRSSLQDSLLLTLEGMGFRVCSLRLRGVLFFKGIGCQRGMECTKGGLELKVRNNASECV